MINCFKDPFHVLMTVLLSSNDDDDDGHEEAVVDHVDGHRYDEPEGVDTKVCRTLTLRSSLRKVDSNSTEADKVKKKVQWVDVAGIKELAEVREFEPSGDDDSDEGKNCVCVIL